MAVPELAPAGDIQFGLPAIYAFMCRKGRGNPPPNFRVRFARQWLNPLSKFLDPPLKGHPDSGLYNLVPFPLTHTHKLKTLSASSVVPYLTTDNQSFCVPAPWKRMQRQTSNLTLRKMSATSHTTANFVHKRYISAKIRSIFL